jgi:hypothetical protein
MLTTPKQNMLLADKHINMYEARLDSGHKFVCVDETQALLRIWRNIKAKGGDNLDKAEQNEITDCLYSGDFDDIVFQCDACGGRSECGKFYQDPATGRQGTCICKCHKEKPCPASNPSSP